MEITLAIVITILNSVLGVVNFVTARKDKAVKETKENNYDLIKYQISEIKEDVRAILNKLDRYDKDIDERIDKAMDLHLKIHHKGVNLQ